LSYQNLHFLSPPAPPRPYPCLMWRVACTSNTPLLKKPADGWSGDARCLRDSSPCSDAFILQSCRLYSYSRALDLQRLRLCLYNPGPFLSFARSRARYFNVQAMPSQSVFLHRECMAQSVEPVLLLLGVPTLSAGRSYPFWTVFNLFQAVHGGCVEAHNDLVELAAHQHS
jgi:hypothetical protein